jgi:hypothetical protein
MAGRSKASLRVALVLAVAGSGACAGGGCGSSSSSEVKAAVTSYLGALARHDGAAACERLSKSARAPFDHFGRGQTCATLLTAEAKQQIVGAAKRRLEAAKVVKVAVAGQSATATVAVPGRQSTISLVQEGGQWKIQNGVGT